MVNRIRFEKTDNENVWRILNDKDEMLGYISYDHKWEQFVYQDPELKIKFAVDCLEAMIKFIKKR